MRFEWVFIEALAVFIENFIFLYFLYNWFISKRETIRPEILTWVILSIFGLTSVYIGFSGIVYDIGNPLILITYLFIAKRGKFLIKILFVIIIEIVVTATTILSTSIVSVLTDTSTTNILDHQDTSRLLALIFVKAMQVVLFYMLSRRRININILKKKSSILFSLVIVCILSCLLLIFYGTRGYEEIVNHAYLWTATGLLLILVVVFLLYEMLAKEESANLDLSAKLQRLELEANHFKEIDVMYSDLNRRHHEYKNSLILLRTQIENGDYTKAIQYIDEKNAVSMPVDTTLLTGNLVLDAVVNTKLWYAKAQKIETDVHVFYPENNVEDSDLCALIGNLLDNAIEGCLRMSDDNKRKFISLSMFPKGKNMTISVSNSFGGIIKKEGNRFTTSKDKRFHGIGIEYIDSIVAKYQGQVLREYINSVFETHIVIPLINVKEQD